MLLFVIGQFEVKIKIKKALLTNPKKLKGVMPQKSRNPNYISNLTFTYQSVNMFFQAYQNFRSMVTVSRKPMVFAFSKRGAL